MGKDKDDDKEKDDKPTDGGRHDVGRDGQTGKSPEDIDPDKYGKR